MASNIFNIKNGVVASGSVVFPNLITASNVTNVLMLSSSGQVYYTASSAIGGGTGTGNITGSGTATYLPLWSGSSGTSTTLINSEIYQSGSNSLGIFTTTPTYSVDIQLQGKGDNGFRIRNGAGINNTIISTFQNSIYLPTVPSSSIAGEGASFDVLLINTSNNNLVYRTLYTPGGTGAGFPFSGSAVITGSLTISGSSSTSLTIKPFPSSSTSDTYIVKTNANGEIKYEGFKQYSVIFSCSPDVTKHYTIADSLKPDFTRISTGAFKVELTNAWVSNKTAVMLSPGITSGDVILRYRIYSTSIIYIYSYQLTGDLVSGYSFALTDSVIENAVLDIRVYSV